IFFNINLKYEPQQSVHTKKIIIIQIQIINYKKQKKPIGKKLWDDTIGNPFYSGVYVVFPIIYVVNFGIYFGPLKVKRFVLVQILKLNYIYVNDECCRILFSLI
ncbi:hypothetical protein ACJX0J_038786, partial [Zea mays]